MDRLGVVKVVSVVSLAAVSVLVGLAAMSTYAQTVLGCGVSAGYAGVTSCAIPFRAVVLVLLINSIASGLVTLTSGSVTSRAFWVTGWRSTVQPALEPYRDGTILAVKLVALIVAVSVLIAFVLGIWLTR